MATEESGPARLRQRFHEVFNELVSSKSANSFYFNNEQYQEMLESVKLAKNAKTKTTLQYRRLKRFDICSVRGVEKLIARVSSGESSIKYYVTNDEMFDILHDAHLAIGHGGKHRMESECKKKYKNVTQDVIKLYLRLCEGCQKKLKSVKKGLVVKPMVFSEMNSRCQVDLIDMQSHPDGEYKFIMVYQDHLTKFVQIRALKSKRAEEVAKSLIDIFCIFGAPSILQSDNGREFANRVIEELCCIWSGLKIVHGKPRHSQSQGSVERANQDIQNMLMTWMEDENCSRWSEGLRFVQLMKNRAYHDGIKRAPYAAMFGHDIKVGLSTSAFPKETIENLRTEEELEKVVKEFDLGEQPQQEQNEDQSIDSDNPQEDITEGSNLENVDNNYRENANNKETSENQTKCAECDEPSTSANIMCELCLCQKNIQSNRLDAKRNLENQAKKMKALSNSKFPPCSVGDTVRVKIPDVDRGRGDFRNILMTVIEKTDDDFYKLANKRGTIEEMFSRNQFSVCSEKLVDLESVSPEKKSLRQLANEQSRLGGQGYKRCNCKTKCMTNKCKCKAIGNLCNSKCHSSLSCLNK